MRLLSIVLAILLLGILFNSSRKSKVSNHWSSTVTKVVTDKMTAVTGITFNQYRSHIVVRKTGHFVEYSILGIIVGAGVVVLRRRKLRVQVNWGWGLFVCLFVPVLDEFIQIFFKRSSSVADVLFDFASSLIGIGIFQLYLKYRRRRRQKNLQDCTPSPEDGR